MKSDNVEEFWSVLDGFGPGLLVALDDHQVVTRPILPVIDRVQNEIVSIAAEGWLTWRLAPVDVVLTFVNEFRGACLTVCGKLRQSSHPDDIATGWTGQTERAFPDGRSCGSVVALRICPSSAELWTLSACRPRLAWSFADRQTFAS